MLLDNCLLSINYRRNTISLLNYCIIQTPVRYREDKSSLIWSIIWSKVNVHPTPTTLSHEKAKTVEAS